MNIKHNIAEGILFTDQYQLSMAQLYFRQGLHKRQVQFDYFFRNYPKYGSHQAGYCVSAGLETLLGWMNSVYFTPEDIDCLRSQHGQNGTRIFQDDFLLWLEQEGNFQNISMQAVPEGRIIHPGAPLAVLRGDFAMLQILETSLLNHLNFQTLIATKASRMVEAGKGQPVLEFGLRRAQGKGANAGVRGAIIGGAVGSSNVGISHVLGLQPKGTHAHSLIQAFIALGEGELGAFNAYAELYPDDCLLLVDTINTLESGVPNAIKVFEKLKANGHRPLGIRLDSGDLAYLSMKSAKMLDDAGFEQTSIVLSNQLDEIMIWQIISQIQEEAPRYGVDADKLIKRLAFGVGTSLITSKGQAALDGVYKLAAVQDNKRWVPAIKISESPRKTLNPGAKTVWRLYDQRGKAIVDLVGQEQESPSLGQEMTVHHPIDSQMSRTLKPEQLSRIEPILQDILIQGKQVYELPTIAQIQSQREEDLSKLDSGVKRLVNPHIYHVSLSKKLWALKRKMIQTRKQVQSI